MVHIGRKLLVSYATALPTLGVVVMSTDYYSKFWQKQSRDRDWEFGEADASKDGSALLGQHRWVAGGECPTLKETLIQPIEAAQIQTTLLAQAQVLLRKTIGELRYNKSQRSTRGAFCRICKECMVIDKPARSGREESKSVLEFQVQIKRKKPARIRWKLLRMVKLDWWKACNETDEGWPATGLVTCYQPDGADTLPEFEVEIQRPQKRVKCRQRAWLWLLWEF